MTRSASAGPPSPACGPSRHARGRRCGRRCRCPGGPGTRTRRHSPWASLPRIGKCAGRSRRWRRTRPARSRGRRRRRRCRGRRTRGDHPAALQPAEDQRADALRVTGGVEGVLVHEDEAEGAAHLGQHLAGRLLDGQRLAVVVHLAREQGGDQVGVVGRRDPRRAAVLLGQVGDQLGELGGVDEVAVVPERDGALRGGTERRLGVLPHGGTGGSSSGRDRPRCDPGANRERSRRRPGKPGPCP